MSTAPSEEMIAGMPCYILKTSYSKSVPTLLMFYGGGFCLNTMQAHQAFMANILAKTPCNIILPAYPLAPETKAPDVITKTSAFLQALLTHPFSYGVSEKLVLMGWSSGSNLALTTLLNLKRNIPDSIKKISQLILLSPWIDLSMKIAREGPYQAQQNADTIAANTDLLETMASWYLPEGFKGDEASVCPASRNQGEMAELPLVTVISGGCEVLLGDGVLIADKLRRAGNPVQLIILEGQTHNYLVFDQLSRDGVFVPELIANIIGNKPVSSMIGKDGLGLSISQFNIT